MINVKSLIVNTLLPSGFDSKNIGKYLLKRVLLATIATSIFCSMVFIIKKLKEKSNPELTFYKILSPSVMGTKPKNKKFSCDPDKLAIDLYCSKSDAFNNEGVIVISKEEFDDLKEFSKSNGKPLTKDRSVYQDKVCLRDSKDKTAYCRYKIKKSKDHPLKDVAYEDIIIIIDTDIDTDLSDFDSTLRYRKCISKDGLPHPSISRKNLISYLKSALDSGCVITNLNEDQSNRLLKLDYDIKLEGNENKSTITPIVNNTIEFQVVLEVDGEVFISHEKGALSKYKKEIFGE